MVIVTDFKTILKNGKVKVGYYMDGYLAESLSGIIDYLNKGFDSMGIISGSNRVGVGKSTLAMQVGYYIAWMIAGGRMHLERNKDGKFIKVYVDKKPTKPVRFGIDNIVFSPKDVISSAITLPRKSIIMYDEGRMGLDSKSTMSAMNRDIEEFFQVCRIYGHIFIVVLPNAFKLHEDYFVSRSDWILDTYLKDFDRGYFRMWGRPAKEKLYAFGKKLLGAGAKYNATRPGFYGRFPDIFILDKEEYEKKKLKCLRERESTQTGHQAAVIRDTLAFLYKKEGEKTAKQVAKDISEETEEITTTRAVEHFITNHKDYIQRKQGYIPESEELP